ncbi:MAG: PhoU domain-containing protein [Sedimenticolaceae bacterium]
MKHYEKRLEQDERDIRENTAVIAALVSEALKNAVHAVRTGNQKLANLTVLGDGEINRAVRAVDHDCHRFIVRHLPSAGHLRLMSATIRAVIALERIGDYAVSIARVATRLSTPPDHNLATAMDNMAAESAEMLERAMQAFLDGNAEQAKAIALMADQVERLRAGALDDLAHGHAERTTDDLFAMFTLYSMLERVSDQAKNLCEEGVFSVTGQTKAAKVYRILFLDREGARLAPMAEALARENFPNSGKYQSAALAPVQALDPGMVKYMATRGIDVGKVKPHLLDMGQTELAEYHVVVSLQGPIGNYLQEIPFHTATLEWDLAQAPDDSSLDFEAVYRALSVEVRVLMERLRGPEAD